MAKFHISFILLLSVIFSASAQEQLTHFRATSAEDQLSNPTYFTEVNGKLLFLATQGDQDTEIWVVDGTPGTPPALLKDINPGASGSAAVLAKFAPNSVFESAAILNGFLYFSANDGQTGFQLWKTDGTAQHTERVTDNLQTAPFSLTVVGTTLYFMTGPYQWANTLWKSDGTKQGTTVVAADFPKYSSMVFSVACNNMLFFALGLNGSSEFTLWRSNGTTGGTMTISDPLKRIGNSDVMPVAVHNNELYVVAKGDVFGEGNTMLFKMDGNSGYSFIKSLDNGGYGSFEFADARVFDDHVYFSFFDWDNNREIIWKTDGTLDGAVNLYDVTAPSYFTPMPFYTFDNTLVFSTANADKGTSLSGIAAGSDMIEPIADISQNDIKPTFYFPGISEGIISKLDDRYVIQLSDDWFSTAAYLSDLTTANTKRVSLLDDIFATYLFKDRLYFRFYQEGIGTELFSLEPGSETPSLVANINTTRYGMSTLYVRTIQDNVFFDGVDVDRQLWLYQGNLNSIKGFDHDPYALTVIGDQLYYSTNGAATASELRRTANETSTVIPPKDASQAATYFDDFTLYKNSVYFTALSNATGTLFLGKIEDSGYSLITDLGIMGASYTFSTVKLKVSGDKLYVGPPVANDIWVSDGTASGTTILLHTGSGLSQQMEAVDNRLFFFGISDTGDETELWVTQGTEASTVLLKTFNLNEYTSTHGLVRLGNAVLFNASTVENGSELWRSDGTPEGTTLVKDIFAGPASGARDAQLTVYQGKAYFNGTDSGGSELWVTDGTAAGTKLVKDINAIGGSVPKEFAVVGDFLYFQAYDPTNGTELWRTDGTAANTKLVSDVAPGSISSNPAHIVGQGDDIVFVATVGIGGDQLWRVTPTPITAVESPEQGELLAVYPNPAETRIMLHTKTPAAIRNVALYDLQGRNVTGVYSGDDNSMSVGHLSAGVYILTAETPQGQFRTLVVKK